MKVYDKFGRAENSVNFRYGELEPYMIDEASDSVTYICYTDDAERAIKRITEIDNITTIEIGFGAWDDRADLTNYGPINKEIDA